MGPARNLDTAAAQYAALLADPCSGPLVKPIFPGGNTGFLFRAESFGTYGASAGETTGIFHWTPGYVNGSFTDLLVGSGAASGTAVTMTTSGSGNNTPGRAFLNTNVRGVRCVAACMKISFPGAESARSGRVHYGHTTAGMIDAAASLTPDSVAASLQHYSRTPTDIIEIVWKPNHSDFEFNDPSETAVPALRDRKSSVTVAWAGFPAATGLTVHLTTVYEWTPAAGTGPTHDVLGKAISKNSFDDVLDALINAGFTFVRSAGMAAGTGLSAAAMAAVSRTFGLMPTAGRERARRYLGN